MRSAAIFLTLTLGGCDWWAGNDLDETDQGTPGCSSADPDRRAPRSRRAAWNGERFVVAATATEGMDDAVYLELHTVDPGGAATEIDRFIPASSPWDLAVGGSPDGALVVWSQGPLVAARVDLDGRFVPGDPVTLAPSGVPILATFDGTSWIVVFASVDETHVVRVARDGTLIDPAGGRVLPAPAPNVGISRVHPRPDGLLVLGREDVTNRLLARRVALDGAILDATPIDLGPTDWYSPDVAVTIGGTTHLFAAGADGGNLVFSIDDTGAFTTRPIDVGERRIMAAAPSGGEIMLFVAVEEWGTAVARWNPETEALTPPVGVGISHAAGLHAVPSPDGVLLLGGDVEAVQLGPDGSPRSPKVVVTQGYELPGGCSIGGARGNVLHLLVAGLFLALTRRRRR